MDSEERKMIDCLSAANSSSAEQREALQGISEKLEECYILNLSPPGELIAVLDIFFRKSGIDSTLKNKAKRLHKKYKT